MSPSSLFNVMPPSIFHLWFAMFNEKNHRHRRFSLYPAIPYTPYTVLRRFSIPPSGQPPPELFEVVRILAMSSKEYAGHRRAAKLRPVKRPKLVAKMPAARKFPAGHLDGPTQQRIRSLLLGVSRTRMSRYSQEPPHSMPIDADVSGTGNTGSPREPVSSASADAMGPAEHVAHELSRGHIKHAAAVVRRGELQCWRAFATWLQSTTVD